MSEVIQEEDSTKISKELTSQGTCSKYSKQILLLDWIMLSRGRDVRTGCNPNYSSTEPTHCTAQDIDQIDVDRVLAIEERRGLFTTTDKDA